MTVYAAAKYATNADLILACRSLGYLADDARTLDPTWGRGTMWKIWQPRNLVRHDLKLDRVDFRHLPHEDGAFDSIVFDPPYKLNGTPTEAVDERYGVDSYVSQAGRHELIRDGISECARVLAPGGHLLVKCQDQVNAGRVRWQTREFADHGESCGLRLVDMLHMLGGRPQPSNRTQRCPVCCASGGRVVAERPDPGCGACGGSGRVRSRQHHALRNMSTMLVLERPTAKRAR